MGSVGQEQWINIETIDDSLQRFNKETLPIVCASLAFVLYGSTISTGGFVWDDRAAVLSNPDVLATRDIGELWKHDFWGQDITLHDSHKSYRPLTVLSFRFDHMIFGLNPHAYHAANVIIYAAVCFFYTKLCNNIFKECRKKKRECHHISTWIASILFVVHPIHTEVVASVVGRSDLLCALFYLISILLYTQASDATSPSNGFFFSPKKGAMFALSTIAGFCSSLSKEIGVTVFGVHIAHEVISSIVSRSCNASKNAQEKCLQSTDSKKTIGKPNGRKTNQGNTTDTTIMQIYRSFFHVLLERQRLMRLFLCTFLCVFYIIGHLSIHGEKKIYSWSILENHITLIDDKTSRVLSYAYVHVVYLWKLIYPFKLCFDYGWPCIPTITTVFDVRNGLSLAMYFSVTGLVWVAITRRNCPMLWSLALALLPFVPASNVFFPVGTVVGERLLFLPSMGFCIGVSLGIIAVLEWIETKAQCMTSTEQLGHRKISASKASRTGAKVKVLVLIRYMVFIFAGLVIATMCLKTVNRCADWTNERTLFESALDVCPTSLKVLNNLALTLINIDKERAGKLLDTALQLHPKYPSALLNRGILYYRSGEVAIAEKYFERSLAINPNQPKVRLHMGQAKRSIAVELTLKGENEKAAQALRESLYHIDLAINGGVKLPLAYHIRCDVGHEIGVEGGVNLQYCNEALDLNRKKSQLGHPVEELIAEDIALNTAGIVLLRMGRMEEALRHFNSGLSINGSSFDLLVNTGAVYTHSNHFDSATDVFQRALQLRPDSPELIANIGWLAEKEGKCSDARKHYLNAIEMMQPSPHPRVVANLKNLDTNCLS